jgi:cold shock CspA family protein
MNSEKDLKGIVKWFSKSANYGFITTQENIDYYFNGEDLRGLELERLDEVIFTPTNSTKKFKAKNIRLEKKHDNTSDTIICNQCKEHMHPELRTFEVTNKYLKFIKSVEKRYECPYCSHVIGRYEERNGSTHLIACIVISIISLAMIYTMYKTIKV